MKTLKQAKADLLAAYQQLEQAQQQGQAIQNHVRQCELRKVQAEAIVALLSEPAKEQA